MTQQLVNTLVSQVEQHIHGESREQILSQLEQNPTADTLAKVTHDTIMSMDQQAEERGAPLDIEVILGVATETIDLLIEIMEAMGVDLNLDEMREETLIKLVMLHMQMVEGDPEEKAAAQEMLIALSADGTMEQSMMHINKKADASEDQMQAAGTAMAAPKPNPVAAGVRQGLMQ